MEKQETKTASPYELDGRPPLKHTTLNTLFDFFR